MFTCSISQYHGVVYPSILRITNDITWMSPEVADEANLSKKASPTGRAEVGSSDVVGAGCSSFPHPAFVLCSSVLCSSVLRAPNAVAQRQEGLSAASVSQDTVNGEVFERKLQVVLEALLLPSHLPFPNSEFSIEELFRDAVV